MRARLGGRKGDPGACRYGKSQASIRQRCLALAFATRGWRPSDRVARSCAADSRQDRFTHHVPTQYLYDARTTARVQGLSETFAVCVDPRSLTFGRCRQPNQNRDATILAHLTTLACSTDTSTSIRSCFGAFRDCSCITWCLYAFIKSSAFGSPTTTDQKLTPASNHPQPARTMGADLDDIEDMVGEEELARAAVAPRAAIVAPKQHARSPESAEEEAAAAASVPGTQRIWYRTAAVVAAASAGDVSAE